MHRLDPLVVLRTTPTGLLAAIDARPPRVAPLAGE